MNCQETLIWVAENDWAVLPDEITQHCGQCSVCQEKIDDLQGHLDILKQKEDIKVDFSKSIMQKIQHRKRMRNIHRFIIPSMSAAASVAIIWSVISFQHAETQRQEQQISDMFHELYAADASQSALGDDFLLSLE